MQHTMIEPARELPVSHTCDVLVCGGGIAGIAAALSAARNGAGVLLLEREYMLGGLGTLGLITIYLPICDGRGHQVSFGIAEELLRLSVSRFIEARAPTPWFQNGSADEKAATRFMVQYNPHVFACDAEKLLLDAGVKLLYGTIAAETVVKDGKITAVMIENKSGRSAIEVKSVVDCTGDADICKLSGADTAVYAPGNLLAAWYYRHSDAEGVKLKLLGASDSPEANNGVPLVNRRFTGLDADEITEFVTLSHEKSMSDLALLREKDPSIVPVNFPTIPQLRMTRRLVGLESPDLTLEHTHRLTSIGLAANWRKAGPVYELPFECLHGEKIRNLITAGRCISVSDDLWDITRVIPVCAVTGEAAGTAAAMSDDFTSLDVTLLQGRLADAGVKLHIDEIL